MKKGCLAVVVIFVLFVLGVVGIAMFLTKGAADAGKNFLAEIGEGKVTEAYDSASPSFKSQQSVEQFEDIVKKLGLADFASVSWSSRSTENDRGTLDGSVTTKSGGKIPLHMELIKESGVWKVYSLGAPEAGATIEKPAASGASNSKTVPSEEKLKAMTLKSLMVFNDSVKANDFKPLHDECTTAFRKQISAEKLAEAFKSFVDQQVDIAPIQNLEPAFDPAPAINDDGILLIKGSYPSEPKKVYFELKYAQESGDWRIQGIDVAVR